MERLFLASVFAESADKFLDSFSDSLKNKTVAFIPTAGDPYKDIYFVHIDRKALEEKGFNIRDVDLKNKDKETLRKELADVEVVLVAGGNTFYLLEKVRQSGFDEILKEFVDKGVIFVGSSAGSVLVGPDIAPVGSIDDPTIVNLESTKGVGLVDFVVLPHYGNEKYKPKYEEIEKKWSVKYDLIKITDQEAVVVEGENHKVV